MDFLFGLPKTSSGCNEIWVVVDKFTKAAHFILTKKTFSFNKLAKLYINKIVSQYKTPMSIVSDRDS